MHTVVGIDLGTQHLKVVFYDFENRQIVATEHAPLDLSQGDVGVAEQQSHWWLNALREAMAKVDPDVRVTALGNCRFRAATWFRRVGQNGARYFAPVKLWCDTSTEQECREIMDSFGGAAACLEELGNLILPGYTASKIRWLKKARPQLYRQLDTILLPHDYLNFYLTGERCMEAGDASGTGFLDVSQRTWSKSAIAGYRR